jgi:HEAT repeat protein
LGELGDNRAVGALLQALADEDNEVRRSAADSLGEIKDTRAVDALLTTMKEKNWSVRVGAALALAKLGDDSGVEVIITAHKMLLYPENVADVLRKLGTPKALEALRKIDYAG